MAPRRDGEAEFDEFYQSNARKVIHLVYASTGDLTLAQDCAQEAFSRAWQHWSKVREYDEPLAWVRTVARRLAISAWRRKANQNRAYALHGVDPNAPGPNEDHVFVMAALQTLPRPVREAMALYYVGDLSIDRIAEETATPAGTIKARLHRGRAQLALVLRAEEPRHD